MIYVEIPENPNCATVDLRVFHDLGPARPVCQVRLEREPGSPAWYDVTGWTTANAPCPARLQKVDDSGDGVAFLLFGGDAGLRLRPAGGPAPWRLEDPSQRGEPFILVADPGEVRWLEPTQVKPHGQARGPFRCARGAEPLRSHPPSPSSPPKGGASGEGG